MGETCSLPRLLAKEIQPPQLKEHPPDEKVLRSVFALSHEENCHSKVIALIQSHPAQVFEDDKFRLSDKQSVRLSVLFNFRSNRTRIYSKQQQTDLTSFIQLQIEFSYLSAVFYLLCRREAKSGLLARLIETQQTNSYGAYSAAVFCNGEKHGVVVDDRMPTQNDNFVYSRIVKGIQLWPLILQKVWCKQIGSYERAKGLSPEDAFQEITGVPAYTYTIKAANRAMIKALMSAAVAKGFWVALIALNGLADLANRQVFYLESIDMEDYTIISPYVSYSFEYSLAKRRGEVVVREDDIFSHFEHVVVGFYKQRYVPVSVPVASSPREELLFEINVHRRQEVSIRFNQLYHGYFDANDRMNYEYSSVMMELYEISQAKGVPISQANGGRRKCKLVNYCQGCPRSLSGSRSTQCSLNIMQPLEGKYLLRLQIGWRYGGVINSGNLVAYASQGNLQLFQLKDTALLFAEIYPSIFQTEKTSSHILHQHSLEIKTFDKEKSTLIMFHNVTNTVHHVQADFSQSSNIRLRGKDVKGHFAFIRLQPDQRQIIEVSPDNLMEPMEIHNFQMTKIPVKPS